MLYEKDVRKMSLLSLIAKFMGGTKQKIHQQIGRTYMSHLSMLDTVAFIRIQSLKLTGKPKCFPAEADQDI